MHEQQQPIAREMRYHQELDDVVSELFGDQSSLSGFIDAFNQYFQGQYQHDFMRKLTARACQQDKSISCSGAALMVESFVRQKLKNQYKVAFLLDYPLLNPVAHTIVVLVPTAMDTMPEDTIQLRVWLGEQFKQNPDNGIIAFHADKGTDLIPFDIQNAEVRRKYGIMAVSVPQFIASRYTGFMNKAAAEGVERVAPKN